MKIGGAPMQVTIDASQFPEAVSKELQNSLRTRQINHKFHYETHKQAQKWLAVHRAHSPFQTNSSASEIYRQSFRSVLPKLPGCPVHVVGLGCGSGQKDAELLGMLNAQNIKASYTPVDVSVPLLLRAGEAASQIIDASRCHPIACDLVVTENLPAILEQKAPASTPRIVTFFGMLPNFLPTVILPRLKSLLRPNDFLLFSANLAPGNIYRDGLQQILPQYDNPETRDWLLTFLLDLGVEKADGELRIQIEEIAPPIEGVVARFHFNQPRRIEVEGEPFHFQPGEQIRLFFSCRQTPSLVARLLNEHGLADIGSSINSSGEEGVFLAQKK